MGKNMLLRELMPVLCGKVNIFEDVEGACASPWFKDLYSGQCKEIPEEFRSRRVGFIMGSRDGAVDISLGRK